MRICHLISSLQYGGAEKQFVNVLNNIKAEKKHAILLTDSPSKKGFYNNLSPEIKVYSVPFRTRHFYYYIFNISRFLKKEKIDILQTHMYSANLHGTLAGKIAGVPVVITTEHGANPWKKEYHYFIERHMISPLVDRRICVSKNILDVRKKIDKVKSEKLIYIPNGLHLPSQHFPKPKQQKIIIGTVGRLIGAKDYATLIRACAHLKSKQIDFQLYIVGDGPLRNPLYSLINEMKLKDHITITGYQDNIYEWMHSFDIFVISSLREGQPLVLLEAMACGLPIIATNVGGIPETVDHGKEALLIKESSPEKLSAAILELYHSPEKRIDLAKNARKKVESEFSIQKCCESHLKLYTQLLKEKNATFA